MQHNSSKFDINDNLPIYTNHMYKKSKNCTYLSCTHDLIMMYKLLYKIKFSLMGFSKSMGIGVSSNGHFSPLVQVFNGRCAINTSQGLNLGRSSHIQRHDEKYRRKEVPMPILLNSYTTPNKFMRTTNPISLVLRNTQINPKLCQIDVKGI